MKNYYPQVLTWFEDRGTLLFFGFLSRWPTLDAVQRARPSTLKRFFYAHHVRSAALIERRLNGIEAARPLTTDQSIIAPNRLSAQAVIAQLREILGAIALFDKEIAQYAQSHPDFALFDALPGAGPALVPRLMVAFGDQRKRYTSAADMEAALDTVEAICRCAQSREDILELEINPILLRGEGHGAIAVEGVIRMVTPQDRIGRRVTPGVRPRR